MDKQEYIPTYKCKHHHWQSWKHYDEKMWESGCKLKGGLFNCRCGNALLCKDYEPKEKDNV